MSNQTPEFSLDLTPSLCPNEKPLTADGKCKIALVGEAPGEDESMYKRPFVGASGKFLTNVLHDAGITRHECFLGNVAQIRPAGNSFDLFDWKGVEVQQGIVQLAQDITTCNPNIIILLGNASLHLAKEGNIVPPRDKQKHDWQNKVSNWRGSLFKCYNTSSPFNGRKCIATYHPANVLRDWSHYPLFKHDLKRARAESNTTDLELPQRELRTTLSCDQLCAFMDTWPDGVRCGIDIEGGLEDWRCVSLSDRPSRSTTIAWNKFNDFDCGRLLRSFAILMARRAVPKVLQNGLYDNFVQSYGFGVLIRGVVEETLIKGWEIFCELPRALSVQASIYTREPFYKDDEMYQSTNENLYIGCARDSAVTLEICNAQDGMLSGTSMQHYRTMVETLNPFLYMQLRGIKYDTSNIKDMLVKNNEEIQLVGNKLQLLTGYDLRGKTSLSTKKLANFLYNEKGYPPQYKKENGRLTDSLTTDQDALLTLGKNAKDDPILQAVLKHRHLESVRETLQITGDPDNRVRCRYSLEAETGRVKCYKSPTGSGANMQTIQSALRINYLADPDYDFFQGDLEGADGWTVAAHSTRLGDDTLMLDYKAGMKPAKILALIYILGPEIEKLDREELKWAHNNLFPPTRKLEAWLYQGCKRIQHGGSYLMGIPTMQLNVRRDSYKDNGIPVYMDYQPAKVLLARFFSRYKGIPFWHSWAEAEVVGKGTLTAASGHHRVFFGRRFGRDIQDTVRQFLAHEPQNVTTWVTNMAALKLWKDPGNRLLRKESTGLLTMCDGHVHFWSGSREGFERLGTGSLLIEPLHQVHDALCVQWPKFLRHWAIPKMHYYFDNEITVAGVTLKIPFDGGYGRSWGEAKTKI